MHSSRRRLDIFEHMPTTATPANRRCSPVCTDLSPHIEALLDADVLAFCKAVSKQGTPVASGRAVAMPTLELRSPPLVKALNPKAAEWQPPPMAAESSAPPSPTAAGGAKRKDAKSLNVDAPEFCPAGGWQQGDDAPTATAMAAQIRVMAQELEAATKRAAQAEAALSRAQGTARAQREELEQEVERLRAAANGACAAQQREKREADDLRRRTAMLGDEVCELHAQKDGLMSQLAREQGERARLENELVALQRTAQAAEHQLASVATLASLQNELAALRIAVNQPASAHGGLPLPPAAMMQPAASAPAALPLPTPIDQQPPLLLRAASAPAPSLLFGGADGSIDAEANGTEPGAVRTHRSRRGGRGKGHKGKSAEARAAAEAALAASKENAALNGNGTLPLHVSTSA